MKLTHRLLALFLMLAMLLTNGSINALASALNMPEALLFIPIVTFQF